jgi:hypothetical protein
VPVDRGLPTFVVPTERTSTVHAAQLRVCQLTVRVNFADPANAGSQRQQPVSYNKLGDLMASLSNGVEAERLYRNAVGIAERLAAADQANATFQRDLSVCSREIDRARGRSRGVRRGRRKP